jgi:hypothetical protein
VEERWIYLKRSEADAGDAEGIAFAQPSGKAGSFDGKTADTACFCKADQCAGLLDDAREHFSILREDGRVQHSHLPKMSNLLDAIRGLY